MRNIGLAVKNTPKPKREHLQMTLYNWGSLAFILKAKPSSFGLSKTYVWYLGHGHFTTIQIVQLSSVVFIRINKCFKNIVLKKPHGCFLKYWLGKKLP